MPWAKSPESARDFWMGLGSPLAFLAKDRRKMDSGGLGRYQLAYLPEFFIFPLNSPAYDAPDNGAIEESRGVKKCMRDKLGLAPSCSRDQIEPYAEATVNDLNHRLRGCLGGKTFCQVFFPSGDKPSFTKRERRDIRDIYDGLIEKAERMLRLPEPIW
jgi:hypothetical protein